MSDPNFPPPPGGTPPPPPPPGGGMPPPPGGMPPQGPPPAAPPPGGFGGGGGFTPPPAQPYGGGGQVPPLEVGAAIGYGWKKFTENVGPFILLMLAVFVGFILVGLVNLVLSSSSSSFVALLWNLLITFIAYTAVFMLQAGVWRAGLGVTRGATPSVSQLTETKNLAPYAVTVIIVYVVPNLISELFGWVSPFLSLLVLIPIIIWGVVTAFAGLLALDKGLGPVEAITQSINLVKDNAGQVLLILIVSGLVYIAGACLCGIGLFVSAPVALVAITYAYRALNNEPVAP